MSQNKELKRFAQLWFVCKIGIYDLCFFDQLFTISLFVSKQLL